MTWRTSVHASGVDIDAPLRAFIEDEVRRALGDLGSRIGHVHIRLYGDVDGTGLQTCYVRVDTVPGGGLALGDTAADLGCAVSRALSRVGAAVRGSVRSGSVTEARTGMKAGRTYRW